MGPIGWGGLAVISGVTLAYSYAGAAAAGKVASAEAAKCGAN